MNNFKKHIYKTINTTLFSYNILQGDFLCSDNSYNITNTTSLIVYTYDLIDNWSSIGTTLYSDSNLTIPITSTFIKYTVPSIGDYYVESIISGVINNSSVYAQGSPC